MARTGVAEPGSSEAALLREDESDCIDSERCLLRRVSPASKSATLVDGDAAGDGRLIAVRSKREQAHNEWGGHGGSPTFAHLLRRSPQRRASSLWSCRVSVARCSSHQPPHSTRQTLSEHPRLACARLPQGALCPQPPSRHRSCKQRFFFFPALPSSLCNVDHVLGPVLHLANPDRSKVTLVCGGGSGHEPSHSAFVGGCLDIRHCRIEPIRSS